MKKLYVIICLLLVTCVLCSCDDLLEASSHDRYANLPSVTCNLKLQVGDMMVKNDLGTRASIPSSTTETINDNEKKVHNVWIFQFAENGSKLLTAGYYTIANQDELSHLPVALKAVDVKSTILAVTNTNDPHWMKGKNINTLDDLKALSLGEPRPISSSDLNSEVFAIPMEGQVDNVNTNTSTDITVPVELMYAKLKIKVKILKSVDASLYNVNVTNIPWNSTVGSRSCDDGAEHQADEEKSATYPEDTQWVSRSFSPSATQSADDSDGASSTGDYDEYGDYVIYVPENIQGENNNPSTTPLEKGNAAPGKALAISTTIKKKTSTDESLFTVYPGGNNYNNFNIKRNRVYRIEVTLKSFKQSERQPSANCFVVIPGNTLSFEPYYRIEQGGGYDFSNYLDTRDTNKKIAKVSILWQTKDCIGDNSSGDLVYLGEPDNSGTIPSKQKIYVKTNKEGNAVIAAYNSSDEIIWSWHIWVTDNDPGNIGNSVVYTTYDWDATGINSDVRVPRYAIMPCNLGALSMDFPTLEQATRCHGMLYQWGRKDPFPPIEKMDIHYGGDIYDYTSDIIGKYYGNDNTTEVGMTAGEETDKLFHSVAGATIKDTPAIFNNPVGYTVNHPTVFMCGTERCNPNDIYNNTSSDDAYVSRTGNYIWQGDWYPQHDDKLWGATEPKADDSMKYLEVATARIWRTTNPSDGYDLFKLHIFDNYGPDKTIFDPCPAGWRVSSGDLWLGFTRTGWNPTVMDDVNYDETYSASWGMSMYMRAFRQGPTSYFPCQGLRFGDGTVGRANRCGNYHNATPDVGNHVNIVHIHNDIGFFHNLEYEYFQMFVKSAGCPVRCVRDRL